VVFIVELIKRQAKSYVGSATTRLPSGFITYYSKNKIEKILNRSKSHIISAILKYSHSKFTLPSCSCEATA